ncbi:hypothetical protein [Halobaculum lipolyticum]|uniref:Uncharacterized protein n=1 Tax=Halobaculum lipolyticum TaxID=3032001 RepID=A0ABD5W5S5_9EURY|nr:hypothetical protein [Halobaculum sp. DT31]
MNDADADGTARSPRGAPTLPELRRVPGLLRRDPWLAVPFLLAAVVVGLVGLRRRRDALPSTTPDELAATLHVEPSLYPAGTQPTVRHVGAFVDARPVYLAGAVGLEAVAAAAVALAGWVVVVRSAGARYRAAAFARYLGVVLLLGPVPTLLGSPSVDVDGLFPGLFVAVVGALVVVRLFLVPGFLAVGAGVPAAVRRSVAASRGRGWRLLAYAVGFGTASWLLARHLPGGGVASTALVGTVHAATLGTLVADAGGAGDAGDASGDRDGDRDGDAAGPPHRPGNGRGRAHDGSQSSDEAHVE